jgi:hypothetical protein
VGYPAHNQKRGKNEFQNIFYFFTVAVFFVSVKTCAIGVSARVSNIYLANAIDDTNKITTFAPTDTIFVIF